MRSCGWTHEDDAKGSGERESGGDRIRGGLNGRDSAVFGIGYVDERAVGRDRDGLRSIADRDGSDDCVGGSVDDGNVVGTCIYYVEATSIGSEDRLIRQDPNWNGGQGRVARHRNNGNAAVLGAQTRLPDIADGASGIKYGAADAARRRATRRWCDAKSGRESIGARADHRDLVGRGTAGINR